jgi:hypothetical protein
MIYPFIFLYFRGFVCDQNFNISDVAIIVRKKVNFCNNIAKMNIDADSSLTFSALRTAPA